MTTRKDDMIKNMEYIDGITIIDTSGTILFSVKFNPAFNPEVFDNNILGKKLNEVFTNINEETSTLIKSMKFGIPIYKKRQAIVSVTEDTIYTTNISVPIKSNGRVIGAIELSKDVTDYKKESNDIIEMNFHNLDHKLLKEHFGPDKARYTLDDIISEDSKIKELKSFIEKIANSTSPVFIYGETGTGKELFAHAIHNAGVRKDGPFITQNCAAIPENLLESILFGTTRGSFTGACDNIGLFEIAEGGSIFLDEINSMPVNLQSKLLRVLQDGFVRRLGDKKERKINTRIITAANMNPKECVSKGLLRKDIYYRLCALTIHIPPLRERMRDIPILLNFLINKYNKLLNKNIKGVSKEVFELITKYSWPGNVRELEHLIEYAVNKLDQEEDIIDIHNIAEKINEIMGIEEIESSEDVAPLKDIIESIERTMIGKAIRKTGGNVSQAAELLQIPRQTLQKKINKYNLISK